MTETGESTLLPEIITMIHDAAAGFSRTTGTSIDGCELVVSPSIAKLIDRAFAAIDGIDSPVRRIITDAGTLTVFQDMMIPPDRFVIRPTFEVDSYD